MKNVFVAVLGLALINLTAPTMALAAEKCPAELAQAQAALKRAQASLKKSSPVAKSQEIQAPRGQEIQAPRVKQAAALVGQAEAAWRLPC